MLKCQSVREVSAARRALPRLNPAKNDSPRPPGRIDRPEGSLPPPAPPSRRNLPVVRAVSGKPFVLTVFPSVLLNSPSPRTLLPFLGSRISKQWYTPYSVTVLKQEKPPVDPEALIRKKEKGHSITVSPFQTPKPFDPIRTKTVFLHSL